MKEFSAGNLNFPPLSIAEHTHLLADSSQTICVNVEPSICVCHRISNIFVMLKRNGGSGDENEYLFVENRILEGIAGIAMDKNVDDVFPTSSAFREDNEAGI